MLHPVDVTPATPKHHKGGRTPRGTGHRGEKWEKVGNWTQGEKRGRVSGVLSASLPLLAQEDP
eukprot:1178091-Prorocentrum_minimum.AAC.5